MSGFQKKCYLIDDIEWVRVSTIVPHDSFDQYAVNCAIDLIEAGMTPEEARKEWEGKKEEAMAVGSTVHDSVELDIKGLIVPCLAGESEISFGAYKKWKETEFGELIHSEIQLLSRVYGYAGTCDIVFRNKAGKIVMADFKTGKGFYDSYLVQIGCYSIAYDEMTLTPKIDKYELIRFDKATGEYEVKNLTDKMQNYKAAAICAAEGFYRLKPRRLKNNPLVLKYWGK